MPDLSHTDPVVTPVTALGAAQVLRWKVGGSVVTWTRSNVRMHTLIPGTSDGWR